MESGVSLLVGTRDAQCRPECLRAAGVQVGADRKSITVYLPEATASKTLENLRGGSPIAVTFSRAVDHRTLQVKGGVQEIRVSDERDQAAQDQYLSAFVEQFFWVGLPRSLIRRLQIRPSHAVTFHVDEFFVQTPGPGAGRRVDSAEANT